MSLDAALSRWTRRVPRFRGWHRLLEPVRRHHVRLYEGREDRWTVIDDFEGDLRMAVDRAAYMGSLIYWRGIHAFAEAAMVRQHLPEDGVFVDVGANQGELTLVAARRARRGRVIAFEPVPRWYERLAANVALNAFPHVTLVRMGVSDHAGEAAMYASDGAAAHASFNEGLSSFERRTPDDRLVGTFPVTTLDAWAEGEGLTRLDLVKVDVEGAERAVLEGARALIERFRPTIVMEVNDETFAPGGPAAMLRAAGYALYEVDPFARVRALGDSDLARHDTLLARHATRLR